MVQQTNRCHCRDEQGTPVARAFSSQEHSTPGAARRAATRFLDHARSEHGCEIDRSTDELCELTVSELVTNAAKYAPGPYLMELALTPVELRITVWDSSTHLPVASLPDPDRAGQHGLEIVEAVSRHVDVRPDPVGKRITAALPLHASDD
ncbi:ATP-binding protein [Streptomyces sp. cg28]|uniref:ATP-binding protein n=1 Tax=Streptomyces sp. cg28 TaxID=3403457 RepID=UPI003B20F5A4